MISPVLFGRLLPVKEGLQPGRRRVGPLQSHDLDVIDDEWLECVQRTAVIGDRLTVLEPIFKVGYRKASRLGPDITDITDITDTTHSDGAEAPRYQYCMVTEKSTEDVGWIYEVSGGVEVIGVSWCVHDYEVSGWLHMYVGLRLPIIFASENEATRGKRDRSLAAKGWHLEPELQG
ncbi:hypothetical protein HYFRA_00011709 [Hymenoscyphus fraxineus]|uniref:Uncharacterized protein n=1 Tax=Hymenoscyphus fraxineus TaxID=746836 RepID=A0A9N9KWW0_9HELO|nr:hypothetical protein HYFRA_00011709 [Hymenoscyphus fraxineus]